MRAEGEFQVRVGVSWLFAGDYENQVRAARTLAVVLPIALLAIFLVLYFQFGSTLTTLNIFAGIAVAWAGGFVLIYLYGEPWFADFALWGVNMRELFHMEQISLSVAVWVGFLALFGIAVDNGVLMATYLDQRFAARQPASVSQVRAMTIRASQRRLRPCLMTTATTVLALLPVLTATGTGADIMIPMAIPSVGGMAFVLLTLFSVPVVYCLIEETKLRYRSGQKPSSC
jgi:Cu(I)/Ag(I) efflux system membrane protein CusA/SilA